MMMIYPLKFHPILKQTIWGGDKINQLKIVAILCAAWLGC